MSAPPNSPNSMASTRVPSDTNSMSSAQSECDVIVNVMIKKKTKTTIEEAKAKRRARHEIWKQTTTSEERKAIYKKSNDLQSTKDRKAVWWSLNKDRLCAPRRAKS